MSFPFVFNLFLLLFHKCWYANELFKNIFYYIYFYIMYVDVLQTCLCTMCIQYTQMSDEGVGQQTPLGMEFQVIVSFYVGAGTEPKSSI